ncbi:MAG: hypothetical protein U0228_13245 [Myxococcaceae bacterium]
MGFRCHWVATKNRDLGRALRVTGLTNLGQRQELVDPGLRAHQLEQWLVIVGDGWDFKDLIAIDHALELSRGSEALYFACDDSYMGSELHCFVDGHERWAVEYDGSNGPSTPTTSGACPKLVDETIAAKLAQAKPGVDFVYDAPGDLGLALTGYRHDQLVDDELVKSFELELL